MKKIKGTETFTVLFIVALPKDKYTKEDAEDLYCTGFMEMDQVHEVFIGSIYFSDIGQFIHAINNNIIVYNKFWFSNCYKLIEPQY